MRVTDCRPIRFVRDVATFRFPIGAVCGKKTTNVRGKRMVAGREVTPADHANTERLKTYWSEGAGAARIGWGTDGDFARCIVNIQEAVSKHGAPLPDRMIKGLCAELHKRATGATPGHAAGETGKH